MASLPLWGRVNGFNNQEGECVYGSKNLARKLLLHPPNFRSSSTHDNLLQGENLDHQNHTNSETDNVKEQSMIVNGTSHAFRGWYADGPWQGEAHLYKMEKVIFEGKSEFQELLVFESAGHGKVAILNGYLQLTEKDEFAYQEMLTHLALCSIPNPKKVLLVGGGDGGILREISRHSSVEHIDICEMDTMIIDVYKQFFPDIAVGYKDPRVHVHIAEGIGFIKSVPQGTYDVIILDAFNSMGPSAKVLSKKSFLESVAKGLRAGGVMSAPADSLWRKGFVVADTIALCKKIFKGSVNYAWTTIPAYPSGAIGFMLCSTEGPEVNFKIPVNPLNPKKNGVAKGPTKFYNNEIHAAAFCLPSFAIKATDDDPNMF
ncbi:hypothetical protein HN51_070290 [Arachis hypogaea]|uniref:spermidine synthase 1 n=1 Tax=Arachis ipaensis TaxID=130454 RepID=UPI0007AF4802|nr:spermidine synthase 1 [Arachis ipaensis]XP_025650941.1 spermidine synthase 1-like [Arachis hypogaea]